MKVNRLCQDHPKIWQLKSGVTPFNPLPDDKILDWSNLKFDENSRKFSKLVENTVGKGEIAPFPTVFSKGLLPRGIKKCHCVGMG